MRARTDYSVPIPVHTEPCVKATLQVFRENFVCEHLIIALQQYFSFVFFMLFCPFLFHWFVSFVFDSSFRAISSGFNKQMNLTNKSLENLKPLLYYHNVFMCVYTIRNTTLIAFHSHSTTKRTYKL